MRPSTLYILGTSHQLQCGDTECSPAQIEAFRGELRSIFKEHQIRCVAEEMDEEGLLFYKVTSTLAQPLALSRDIQHHNVDLTSEERFALGWSMQTLDSGTQFQCAFEQTINEVRERCWVARILAKIQWPTLFICGAEHSQSVAELGLRFGLIVEVLHIDYKPCP